MNKRTKMLSVEEKAILLKRSDELGIRARKALMSLGYPSNQNLFSLRGNIYLELRAKEKFPFLFQIIDFYYEVLTPWERRYFRYEIMEKDCHYPFWCYDMPFRSYTNFENGVLIKISEYLLNDENFAI